MSTIKISQLPTITQLESNTSNTVFVGVDITSFTTGIYSAQTLANQLYINNALLVGNNPILFPNTIGQFSGNSATYLQTNFQNFISSGSSDVVLTTDVGTNSNNYIDLGINNSTYTDPTYSSMSALDGYLYVSGYNNIPGYGSLIVGTASPSTNIKFIAGGTTSSNIVAQFGPNSLLFLKPIQFADGSTLSSNNWISANDTATLASAKSYTDTANTFIRNNYVANTSIVNLNNLNISGNISVSGTTQTAAINTGNLSIVGTSQVTGNSIVYGSFTANGTSTLVGNVSMSGTSIVYGNFTANGTSNLVGNMTVTGSGGVSGFLAVNNSTFATNTSLFTLTASNNFVVIPPSNQDYMAHITGKDGYPTRVVLDSFGNGGSSNSYSVIAGRSARGNAAFPTVTQTNDVLMRMGGTGYGTSGFQGTGSARIDLVAAENFTDTNKGSLIQFWTTQTGANTPNVIATFTGSNVTFTGTINPQKGFIYNPNVISGNITTLNIDVANNSLYKFSCNATTTISLSGFQSGKVVEVWLTNTDTGAGSNHTITHGCYANNSTIGTASFTLTSLHSAYLRYFSIDGDLANTFVSINYS